MMRSVRLPGLLLVSTLVLLIPVPVMAAQAVPPVRYTYDIEDEWPYFECDGFTVYDHRTMHVEVMEFYDQDGNWIRTKEHWTADGFVYNDSDPDYWLPEMTVHNMGIFYPSGEYTVTGLLSNIVLPGGGVIIHEVGRIAFDAEGNLTFYAGDNDWIEGDKDALCAALTPP